MVFSSSVRTLLARIWGESMLITRRKFLAQLTSSPYALSLAHSLGGFSPTTTFVGPLELSSSIGHGRHVVILGAGIAGLVAAYELRRAGFECTVLEALSRPGGRCWTIRGGDIVTQGAHPQHCRFSPGLYFNAGAARIHSQHQATLHYCRELHIPLEPVITNNRDALIRAVHSLGSQPRKQHAVIATVQRALAELLLLGLRHPALASQLSESDFNRLTDFLALHMDANRANPHNGATTSLHTGERFFLPPDVDASLWRWLHMDQLEGLSGMLLQPMGGMDRLPSSLATQLGPIVRYAAEVVEIRNERSGVRAVYREGQTQQINYVEADYCISTLPLPVLSELRTDLSPAHLSAIAACEFEDATKIAWQAPRFWEREYGIYGGVSFTGDRTAMVIYPSDRILSTDGILIGAYTTGFASRSFASMPLRNQMEISREAVDHLHHGGGAQLSHGISVCWSELPFSRGSWAKAPATALAHLGPDGRIFFAGDQMTELNGWQEGAILSAHAAVRAIVSHVKNKQSNG